MSRAARDAIAVLAESFHRNGYVREQNLERLAEEGAQQYKKGVEVRLVADSAAELRLLRRSLRLAGFTPGRAFRKSRQYRQPLYGREAVERFLELVDAGGR